MSSSVKAIRVKKEPIATNYEAGDAVAEVSRYFRDVQPAHYLLKIESFSILSDSGMEKYESQDFEVGGYKWRLCLYPSGNEKENGNNHISLYLVICDTKEFAQGWEVNVQFKLFIYDHIRDRYLTIQDDDGRVRRFRGMKTEWGFSQLISLDLLNNTSNGYLFDDSCVFGAEVLVIKYDGKGQCLSMMKATDNNTYTWKINKFSAIEEKSLYSEEFQVKDRKWKLFLYPKGNGVEEGKSLSLFLKVLDCETLPPNWRFYVKFKIRISDQVCSNHRERETCCWFGDSVKDWGFRNFMSLEDLNNTSNGFLVDDTLTAEAEITMMGLTKNLT